MGQPNRNKKYIQKVTIAGGGGRSSRGGSTDRREGRADQERSRWLLKTTDRAAVIKHYKELRRQGITGGTTRDPGTRTRSCLRHEDNGAWGYCIILNISDIADISPGDISFKG